MILFIFSVFIASCSQILLKKGSDKKNIYLNPYTLSGYGLMVVSTFLTVLAYKKVALSTGVLLESISYIFVPILSYFFLKEKISKNHFLGMIIIIIGILVFEL